MSGASDSSTLLLSAAESGNNDTLLALLNQSVPPDVRNASNFTPLILAAYAGNTKGIKLLLERGANLNATTLSGNNAIMMAAQQGKTETVEFLSSVMSTPVGNVKNKNGDTPLMFASKNGHAQTVKLLLKLGAKYDASNAVGMTAISCAASDGHVEVIKELLAMCPVPSELKQSLQSQDVNGNSPLHFASYGGHLKAVEFLLSQGASPFLRNKSDKTPAMDITDALPKFTDYQLIQNVTACRTMLLEKCRELEEMSQKNMDDLTKLDNPEPTKKQGTKQKSKHKKNKSASGNKENDKAKDSKETKIDQDNKDEKDNKDMRNKDNDNTNNNTVNNNIVNNNADDNTTKDNHNRDSGNKAKEPIDIPEKQTVAEHITPKIPLNETTQPKKSQPLDIPSKQNLSGKSPPSQKSSLEQSPTYSSVVKSASPSPNSILTLKQPPSSTLAGPPGFPARKPPTPTNAPAIPTLKQPNTNESTTPKPLSGKQVISPKKTLSTTTDTALLDQALACINAIDTTQSSGHALEIAFKDYSDMCTAMTTIHPTAEALDLPVRSILGLGLNELSMEQLGVLEEIHHKMLQAITDAKLHVVRTQERMRLEEEKELAMALLTTKLRKV